MRPRPSPQLVARLDRTPVEQQLVSSISVGELTYGAYRRLEQQVRRLAQIEAVVLHNLTVVPYDATIAQRYGELRAELERGGLRLEDADLQIAATALVHRLTLVTANVRHFARVPGLKVENWL